LRDLKKTVSVVHAIYSAPKDICKHKKSGGREAEEAIKGKEKKKAPRDKKRRVPTLPRQRPLNPILVSLSSS